MTIIFPFSSLDYNHITPLPLMNRKWKLNYRIFIARVGQPDNNKPFGCSGPSLFNNPSIGTVAKSIQSKINRNSHIIGGSGRSNQDHVVVGGSVRPPAVHSSQLINCEQIKLF